MVAVGLVFGNLLAIISGGCCSFKFNIFPEIEGEEGVFVVVVEIRK